MLGHHLRRAAVAKYGYIDPASIIAFWPMDSIIGDQLLDTVGGYDFTLFNAPTIVPGEGGNAVYFNGSNQYGATLSRVPVGSEFSISVRIKPAIVSTSNYAYLLSSRTVSGAEWQLFLSNTAGKLSFSCVSTDVNFYTATGNTPVVDSLLHIIATFDGSFVRLYEDKVLVDETAFTGTLGEGAAYTSIAAALFTGSPAYLYTGAIAPPRIYNKCLTQTEIDSL